MSKLLDKLHVQMVRSGINPYGGTLPMKDPGEFSVYWWDDKGNQHNESRFVGVDTVKTNLKRLIQGPARALGIVQRIMVTDGGDFCNFEWNKKDGVVFPTEEDIGDRKKS